MPSVPVIKATQTAGGDIVDRVCRLHRFLTMTVSTFQNSTNQIVLNEGEERSGLPHIRENQGKQIFSRSGNCQGILENVREFLPFESCQGIVREFCHDIFFRLRLHRMVRDLPGLW